MDLTTIFGVIGCLTAFITFLPPWWDLYKIWQGSSMEEFSPTPHHAAFISSMLWVMYGDVLGDTFLVIIHRIAVLMVLSRVTLFVVFTEPCEEMMVHEIIFISELAVISLLALLTRVFDDPNRFAGLVCSIGSLLMSAVIMEYESKRMERVPFYVRLGSFVNGAIWFVYGIITSDRFIWVPNLIGALLDLVHLVLHSIDYYRPEPVETEDLDEGSL